MVFASCKMFFHYALGGNRTPILRTGILRAIRCTTRAICMPEMLTVRIIIIAKFVVFYKFYFKWRSQRLRRFAGSSINLIMSKWMNYQASHLVPTISLGMFFRYT